MNKWIVVLLLLPMTTAQTEILTDPADDVEKAVAGTQTSLPIHDGLDLRSLSITESATAFTFDLTIEDISASLGFLEGSSYVISFSHNGQAFRANIFGQTQLGPGDMTFNGNLQAFDAADDRWYNLRFLPVSVTGTTLQVELDREWLLDANGAEPFPGRALEDIYVVSGGTLNGIQVGGPTFAFRDQMPDSEPNGMWDIQYGIQQTGHLRLKAPDPVRASNGEATTFVFEAYLYSTISQEETVQLRVPNIPSEWKILLPANELLLPANETLKLPVVVTVPFKHAHGILESFILEASSPDGTSVGRVELGVRYNEIAQPAGHHNTLYLHTEEQPTNPINTALDTAIGTTSTVVGTMNTEEIYDLDTSQEYAAIGGNGIGAQGQFVWIYSLSPSLNMGLAFDLEGEGTLDVSVSSTLAMSDAVMSGVLRHTGCTQGDFRSCENTILGTFSSDATDIGTSATPITLTFTPEVDSVPYTPAGAGLTLELRLMNPAPSQTVALNPRVHPGGVMTLPFEEYHDPVDENLVSLSGIDFVATTLVERAVNPSETALFNFTLFNTGLVKETFDLTVSGGNDWGRLLGAQQVTLSPGDERRVVVAVEVASDAQDAEVADFVVKATSTRDPTLQGLVPFRVIVDTVFDHKDESDLILETESELAEKSIPAIGAPLLVASLFLARRRKL